MKIPPSRYILPNLFTLGATFCGVAMIWLAAQATTAQDFYVAASLLPLALLLDGFDGRVARWVQGQSKFGVQMDSLSDFLTFGVAPAFLVYFWGLQQLGLWGLLTVFVFAAGAMVRLARFNVQAEEDGGASAYFTGLPAPMAGMAAGGLVAVHAGVLGHEALDPKLLPFVVVFMVGFAVLMVSEVPFRTFKDVSMTRSLRFGLALSVTVVVGLALATDWMAALSVMLFFYVLTGLASSVLRRRRQIAMARRAVLVGGAEPLLDDEEVFEDELGVFEGEDDELGPRS